MFLRGVGTDSVEGSDEDAWEGDAMCDKTPRTFVSLSTSVDAPSRARSFADSALCPDHAAEADAAVKLMASELVTDAVLYGAAPIEVSLECRVSDCVVTVTEGSTARREPEGGAAPQRLGITRSGSSSPQRELFMLLVDKVAREWGIEPGAEGRRLWCTVPTGTVVHGSRRRSYDPADALPLIV